MTIPTTSPNNFELTGFSGLKNFNLTQQSSYGGPRSITPQEAARLSVSKQETEKENDYCLGYANSRHYESKLVKRSEASKLAHYERQSRNKRIEIERQQLLQTKPGSGNIWQPQTTKARSPRLSRSNRRREHSRNRS